MGQKMLLQSKNTACRGEDGGILKLANGRDNFLILGSVAFPVHQTIRVKMQKQLPRKAFPFHMTCDLFVNGCPSGLPAASGNVRCGLLRYLMRLKHQERAEKRDQTPAAELLHWPLIGFSSAGKCESICLLPNLKPVSIPSSEASSLAKWEKRWAHCSAHNGPMCLCISNFVNRALWDFTSGYSMG